MNIITLDFESFYTDQKDDRGTPYTLSRMTTEEYVRHPWFEAHGVAIKWAPDQPAEWIPHDDLHLLAQYDWSQWIILCHHAQFDGLILSHHFGIRPKHWMCTLAMARLLLGNHLGVGLDAVRKHFGVPPKITPYNLFKGKRWAELSPATQRLVGAGACDEVESIWKIFNLLAKDFPKEEYKVVDATIKMFTEPCLRGDVDMLARVWEDEDKSKADRFAELNINESEVQSANQFADLLRAEGIEPDTKEGKNGPIYAFSKQDQFMRDLQEHPNERVQLLAAARLGAKSTLMQTRAATLGWMASRGPMPVYLRYAGAHTTRWSGGDGANWQNFKRGSDIRRAICAPDGHLLAPIDLSQIECRILNYLAKQDDVIERFRNGEDPYIGIASQAYGFPVAKAHTKERGTGKQLELSCGYQAGASTIQNTARLGVYGPPVSIDIQTALRWRDIYRDTHPQVVAYWSEAGRMIARLANGPPVDWGPMHIQDKRIYGPGGTMLHYDTLEFHRPTQEEIDQGFISDFEVGGFWRYRTRNGWTKLYSGKLVENVVQWLARIVMSQAMLRIIDRGYKVVNTTHDELLCLVPKDGREEQHLEIIREEMIKTPDWLPGIPLDAEGSLGERYSK